MKRRDFFTSFANKEAISKKKFENAFISNSITNTSGIEKYSGDWNEGNASHLLKRSLFGHNDSELSESLVAGLDGTIDSLLNDDEPMPEPPIKFFDYSFGGIDFDDGINIGETFVNASIELNNPIVEVYRTATVQAWVWGNIAERGYSLREKMSLFWTNHFSTQTEVVGIGRFQYDSNKRFRDNALGNFKQLVKEVTYDMTMIIFLNSFENRVGNPNENYARELLELFTIGKGPQIGPGNYTNFTEDDIIETAKVLTGITVENFQDFRNGSNYKTGFQAFLHDFTIKQFSEAFQNKTILPTGQAEFDELIDMIFAQEETARHIVRKLYRWFVFYDITDYVEENIIAPLAQTFIENDFEVKPVLKQLLSSEHFYDLSIRGAMIKNPADYLVGTLKSFDVQIPSENNVAMDDNIEKYFTWFYHFLEVASNQEMEMLNPPSVAGWEAYHQFPNYYRKWLSSVTYPQRVKFLDDLFSDRGIFTRLGGFRFTLKASSIEFVESLENAYDPNYIVDQLASKLYPFEITQEQKDRLKLNLVNEGQGDYVWGDGWNEYIQDKSNNVNRLGVKTKLDALINAAISLPEFQLM
jgi:uncharacterized protein (DUF1800 family)